VQEVVTKENRSADKVPKVRRKLSILAIRELSSVPY
jgi:hypothetical protein